MTEETMPMPSGIHAKMARAAQIVGYGVPKDGRNDFQKYDFTSAAAVRRQVGPALGEMGISVSSRIDILNQERQQTVKGRESNYVMACVTLTFSDGGDGCVTVQGIGAGLDSGDKAPMKAQTAAEKYAYLSAFTIAMGEDPEAADDGSGGDDGSGDFDVRQQQKVAADRVVKNASIALELRKLMGGRPIAEVINDGEFAQGLSDMPNGQDKNQLFRSVLAAAERAGIGRVDVVRQLTAARDGDLGAPGSDVPF